MKRLKLVLGSILLSISILCLSSPLPVLAVDPPSTDVNVTVTSGEDINADITLDGNTLNVSVNGGTLANLSDITGVVLTNQIYLNDIRGTIESLRLLLVQTNQSQDEISELYGQAIAKLIQDLTALQSNLDYLALLQKKDLGTLQRTIEGLETTIQNDLATILEEFNTKLEEVLSAGDVLLDSIILNIVNIEDLQDQMTLLEDQQEALEQLTNERMGIVGICLGLVTAILIFLIVRILILKRKT